MWIFPEHERGGIESHRQRATWFDSAGPYRSSFMRRQRVCVDAAGSHKIIRNSTRYSTVQMSTGAAEIKQTSAETSTMQSVTANSIHVQIGNGSDTRK